MLRNRIIKQLLTIALAVIIVFSPLKLDLLKNIQAQEALNATYITESETWEGEKEINEIFFIVNGATLTIKKGSKILFNGNDSNNYQTGIIVLDGKIIAKGAQRERIIFDRKTEKSKFSLSFGDTINFSEQQSFFRYAEISRGGFSAQGENPVLGLSEKHQYLNSAIAQESEKKIAAVNIFQGNAHFENCEFKNSWRSAINIVKGKIEIINSNFKNNEIAVESSADDKYNVLLKDNWYGHIGGPTTKDSLVGKGEKINGAYNLDSWRLNGLIVDPIIIIPGIMGSQQFLGNWKIDPMFHVYDDLIESFKRNGYFENKNLFKFPYQWRSSNKVSALNLQGKTEEVINQTKISKVDLVAHSMGGLVARAYIEEVEGTIYENTIDQLITLGTPHRGSPEAYLKWEAGEGFDGIVEKLIKFHFKNEAKHHGYDNLYEYIQEKVISIKELLPDYDYLYDVSEEDMREYHENYPRNTFLEELNNDLHLEKINDIELINVIGDDNVDNTISKIRVVNSTIEDRWEHGMPENFYDKETDRGLEYGEGDRTVSKFSAGDIPSDKTIEIDSSHRELPTKAQCKILEELAQINEADCEYVDNIHIPNILLFNVFSPIDIKVITPDGTEIGFGINDYEGDAFYSKYQLDNGQEIEFLTIPNPQDGEYTILTQGTNNGEYRIEATKITEDKNGETIESSISIEGIAELNKTDELKVEIQDNEVILSQDTTPPAITIASPENREYLNNQILNIEFEVEDNVSIPENIETEIYLDKSPYLSPYFLDLSLQNMGEHKLKITAQDEAENESEEEITFQTNTNLDALIKNIRHYHELKLIKRNKETRILIKAVENLKKAEKLIQKIKSSKKISENKKDKIIKSIQKKTNRYIDRIIRFINHKSEELIKLEVKRLLVEGLEWVKY